MAGMMEPLAFVFKSAEVTPVIASEDEVACPKVFVPVKTLFVYVFGIVVDPATKVFTNESA